MQATAHPRGPALAQETEALSPERRRVLGGERSRNHIAKARKDRGGTPTEQTVCERRLRRLSEGRRSRRSVASASRRSVSPASPSIFVTASRAAKQQRRKIDAPVSLSRDRFVSQNARRLASSRRALNWYVTKLRRTSLRDLLDTCPCVRSCAGRSMRSAARSSRRVSCITPRSYSTGFDRIRPVRC
jgi:hypothetical protein